jgi:hypothetical protein
MQDAQPPEIAPGGCVHGRSRGAGSAPPDYFSTGPFGTNRTTTSGIWTILFQLK